MIKSIAFIVLTQFFHFKELKILRQPGYFIFFKLNQQYFFTVYLFIFFYKYLEIPNFWREVYLSKRESKNLFWSDAFPENQTHDLGVFSAILQINYRDRNWSTGSKVCSCSFGHKVLLYLIFCVENKKKQYSRRMRWGANLVAKYFGFFRLSQLHFSHLNDKSECKMKNLDSSSLLMLEEELYSITANPQGHKGCWFWPHRSAFHSALTLKLSVNPSFLTSDS